MNHIGTQIIHTQRLTLRRFTIDDASPMFDNWAGDPEVTKYLTWPPHTSVEVTRKLLEGWIADYEKPDYYQWAIELGGQVIGSIGVVCLHDGAQMGEIGYCLGKNWWNRGIMSEALCAVIAFLFEKVGFHCISARHAPENPRSGAVMKKCGMLCDGKLRGHARNNQGICDVVCYSLLRQEWLAHRDGGQPEPLLLQTPRLLLRRFRKEDFADLFEYLSDPAVVAFEPYEPMTEQQVRENLSWRISTDEMIAVELRETGKMIGNVYLSRREFDAMELGFVFNRAFWGRGFARESCEALLQHSFAAGTHRVYAECDPCNENSWRLLQALGFRQEGHLRQNVYFSTDDTGAPLWKDTLVYVRHRNG